MKNTLWAKVGVVVVAVVVIVTLFSKSNNSSIENGVNNTNNTDNTSLSNTVKGGENVSTPTPRPATVKTTSVSGMKTSLGGIFTQKGNYQCDYELVTDQIRSSNVIYYSDGKMRGEFRTTQTNGGTSTIFVYDGSYLYTWTEGKTVGKISQPKTISELPGVIPQDITSGKVLGTGTNNVSYDCHAWSKDASKLVKPSYIKFY